MCLAVPGKIEAWKEHGKTAVVNFSGLKRVVNISLLDGAHAGDWVLVHVGFAIQKIDESTARETYHLLSDMGITTEGEIGGSPR